MCLVDGQGNQVKLLQCPRPCSMAYLDIDSRQDLDAFVVTQTYEMKPQSKKPGIDNAVLKSLSEGSLFLRIYKICETQINTVSRNHIFSLLSVFLKKKSQGIMITTASALSMSLSLLKNCKVIVADKC